MNIKDTKWIEDIEVNLFSSLDRLKIDGNGKVKTFYSYNDLERIIELYKTVFESALFKRYVYPYKDGCDIIIDKLILLGADFKDFKKKGYSYVPNIMYLGEYFKGRGIFELVIPPYSLTFNFHIPLNQVDFSYNLIADNLKNFENYSYLFNKMEEDISSKIKIDALKEYNKDEFYFNDAIIILKTSVNNVIGYYKFSINANDDEIRLDNSVGSDSVENALEDYDKNLLKTIIVADYNEDFPLMHSVLPIIKNKYIELYKNQR